MASPLMNAPSGLRPCSMSSSRSSIRCICCWNCAISTRRFRSDLVTHFVVNGIALDERSERASTMLDVVQQEFDQMHLLLELRDIHALHQVSRTLVAEFGVSGEVLGAGSAGDIDELIANDGIGSGLRGGIVGDAG